MSEELPLKARLYFDEDVDGRLIDRLRQRGYDVQTTVAAGLMQASDASQLAHAASRRRALVTHNIRHFPRQHSQWLESAQRHWGVIILDCSVNRWFARMERLLNHFSAEELQNQLVFLGAMYDE